MTAGRTNKDQKSVHWCTPPKYADAVMRFFNNVIDLDPCSNPYSLIRARVCLSLPDNDGLKHEWAYRHIFVNPPYGKDRERNTSIKDWLCKCCKAHERVLAICVFSDNVQSVTMHNGGNQSKPRNRCNGGNGGNPRNPGTLSNTGNRDNLCNRGSSDNLGNRYNPDTDDTECTRDLFVYLST